MSEHQRYEFCSIYSPLTIEAREEMSSLSSRADIGTHGASYVYNYGNFRGKPEQLLLKYFDVFFYIANWGTAQLMLKYPKRQIDLRHLKKFSIMDTLSIKECGSNVIVDICINNEDGFGWIEDDEYLPEILELHNEIKNKNYQFLDLIHPIHDMIANDNDSLLKKKLKEVSLSEPQKMFLRYIKV